MNNYNPSLQFDPAANDTLVGVLNFILPKFMRGIDGMLPAKVVAYDRLDDPRFVQVQPLIPYLTTGNTTVSRPQIAKIPVYTPGGGGFFISFNLLPGDLGW